MRHVEGTFEGFGDIRLFYQAWLPDHAPRAVVVNLHGLGDHSGLYPNLARVVPTWDMALYSFDMRGNGRSPGQRAYLGSWGEYREDLHNFLENVRAWQPELPLFVQGNSLGGLVVLEYAMHHPEGLAGVIAVAPPLGKVGVPAILMALGRMFSRVLPRFSLQVGMDLSGLARDPAVVQAVRSDPWFHRKGTARLSTEVTAAIDRVQKGAESFGLPLLVLHGSADRMVPPDGSREFFSKVCSAGSEFREYPEAYHVLFADLNAEEVLTDLHRWIESRLPQPGTRPLALDQRTQ